MKTVAIAVLAGLMFVGSGCSKMRIANAQAKQTLEFERQTKMMERQAVEEERIADMLADIVIILKKAEQENGTK